MLNEQIAGLDEAVVEGAGKDEKARLLMTQRGADHDDGVCTDHGRREPLPAESRWPAIWADSARVQFGR
jgi:hypothetical protein